MAGVATDIIDELDSLQTPHVAYWAIVARRLAYPAYFQPSVPSLELSTLCLSLGVATSHSTWLSTPEVTSNKRL